MAGFNKVILIGRLGRDPELRYTSGGKAVVGFSVAASYYSNRNGEQTEWFNVVAWEKLAETCNQYLKKGKLVLIEGRLETRSWEGADGQKKYKTEVVASLMQMLDSKSSGTSESTAADDADVEFDEELPF